MPTQVKYQSTCPYYSDHPKNDKNSYSGCVCAGFVLEMFVSFRSFGSEIDSFITAGNPGKQCVSLWVFNICNTFLYLVENLKDIV